MATILSLETATTNCSVALAVDGHLLSIREDNPKGAKKGFSHAERLHGYIHEVLEEAGIDNSAIDAIAVSKGPGSYTGLRIGVSAAKGLCFSLDIPLISIPTLSSLAHVGFEGDYIVPMLDARRMEVYSAIFNSKKEQLRNTKAEILEVTSFKEYLDKGRTMFVGSGAEKFKEICKHPNASFQYDILPSAKQMIALAAAKNKIGDYENVAYFEPYYLKDFIAG
ncbi:tRNA (adenosine(37)-N6)-threonylcarbamoyltransferase complex dimerization subunit type 1 TsaB [Luteirhabdus pelagi]|uniref:tRNA (adenosine(37)-N6)-threonylcarbamoyltransferase complex dimerization subunit type 1 TsaB n=1 Tax=Luteirhabdus pelagi TaxID=2792783 RepID=UPI001939A83A|nr:tRNA (adenosine(37)-N6)-threonylcarbamoyltransferase complex dimerization subunit type 1 TsaB [Luteirhabdus pelagi]